MSNELYKRRNDLEKCPICGYYPIASDAYRCPNCKGYFCFKCGIELYPKDEKFRCRNQKCEYHGKVLCNNCIGEIPQIRSQERTIRQKAILESHIKYVFFFSLVLIGTLLRSLGLPWWGVVIGSILLAALCTGALSNLTIDTTIVEEIEVGRTKVCYACNQAVEHLI